MRNKIKEAKMRLLKMHFESGIGHIGGNLSCLDTLMYLHHRVMKPQDVFVLSKGHSAGALYVTLWSMGRLSDEDLTRFHADGTMLAGHPPPNWIPEIKFATGSLGHGLSLSAGIALAKRFKGEGGNVYCLLSDGEWNEGSNWEALIFIAHQKIENLTFIIDNNGLQGFGTTKEVADLGSLAGKLRSFSLRVDEIDGHDLDSIAGAFSNTPSGP
ncbi:MAG TPA: 1-deoxy-D-xylulose-5-phosphate synthase N-terminal domain-containing protein, partial [Syntrophales bacterium]|nr:1-deoxy-D-xylulose-5-phosphate synthase N-terminal domain-containing protein [Syntrophales bacterium]